MRLLVVILFLCFVGVTGRRGTTPATSAEHDYFGEHPTKFQRGVLDPWGCTSGWGKREAKKVPESEVEKVKQVKSGESLCAPVSACSVRGDVFVDSSVRDAC